MLVSNVKLRLKRIWNIGSTHSNTYSVLKSLVGVLLCLEELGAFEAGYRGIIRSFRTQKETTPMH